VTERSCGAEGLVLAGKYRLRSLLGRGAMGEVWRAEHLALRTPIAIKLIDVGILEAASSGHREDALVRFEREAMAAAALQSRHVVQVFDHGVDGATPYIAMELLEGEALEDRLDRLGRLPHAETVRILGQVCRAIGRAHDQGIVHRDLKPDNVFLVDDEGEEIAKVLDFGVAKVAALETGGRATAAGSLLGTPSYMSPEQASGNLQVDWRTDLWALGVIAYECVTGHRPFEGGHVGELILQICVHPMPVPSAAAPVPPGFDAWFARACARDREERFQSARELIDELAVVLLGERPASLRDSRAQGPSAPSIEVWPRASVETMSGTGSHAATGRRRSWLVAAALAVGVVAIGAVGVAARTRDAEPATGAPAPERDVPPRDDLRPPTTIPPEAPLVVPSSAAVAPPSSSGRVAPTTPAVLPVGRARPATSVPAASPPRPKDRIGL
jgi:serine/threonine protein kinase